MRPRTRRNTRAKRFARFLKIAGDAGTIVMSLRERPKPLDWIGVALRAIGLAIDIREERRRIDQLDPWNYFSRLGGTEWTEVPQELKRIVLENVVEAEIDDAFWDGDASSPYLCVGRIGDERVGWVGEGEHVIDGPYVVAARAEATYAVLGDRVWRRLGGDRLHYGTSGLVIDPFASGGVIVTAQMTDVAARMRSFLAAGEPRGYLFAGPPGTGKSVAIRWLVDTLGLTSLRIDLAVLARLHGDHGPTLATSLETMLRVLRPRALILDDLDRVPVTASLLAFLELAQRTCAVTIASANAVSKMMGAALRPGRFDDIVTFDHLDAAVLCTLLADDADLHARLAALPAAYVVEFAKRRRVLGRERALVELDDLVARSQQVGEAGDSD